MQYFLSLTVFFILLILLPGAFIWLGLKFIGKDRRLLKCIIANLGAFLFASIIFVAMFITPLSFFSFLVFILVYLYSIKIVLEISFVEALAATILALAIGFLLFVALLLIFPIMFSEIQGIFDFSIRRHF
ncbi:MAG: hypothetical protein QFX40_05150 [Archaeoglobales archaeon]|nr:hypothetical protein [Archaeoglobales archaeon]